MKFKLPRANDRVLIEIHSSAMMLEYNGLSVAQDRNHNRFVVWCGLACVIPNCWTVADLYHPAFEIGWEANTIV